MADANLKDFSTRLKRIDRQHRRLSRGYVRLIERDGMLVPVSQGRVRSGFPFRGLLLTLVGFMVFKGFLLAALGDGVYDFRIAKIASGSGFEQAVAWIMQADPVTHWIAGLITPFF